jgi:hypothetical protein
MLFCALITLLKRSGKYLLTTERATFSDQAGKDSSSSFSECAQNLGVKEAGGWEIDRDWAQGDSDGWLYAEDFTKFEELLRVGRSKSKPKMTDFARR